METWLLYVAAAFGGGVVAALLRLPPLVGFLAAGFALGFAGVPHAPELDLVADLGVTLLLFTIGLKLDVRTLLRRHVWMTTVAHLVTFGALAALAVSGLVALGLTYSQAASPGTVALAAFALSFCSTVFVVTHLEAKGDEQALYGRVAIGILLIQDLAAVVFLALVGGTIPSVWAFGLVLLYPLVRLARLLWARIARADLEILFGILMALGPGYWAFTAVGLKGELGALVVGVLLARDRHADSLARSLLRLKDLLLVGFFLAIGLGGTPGLTEVGIAVALLALLPVKGLLFVVLLRWARLRNRTSALAAVTLGNYSEFGMIVIAVGAEHGLIDRHWLVAVSLAVALSFLVGAAAERRGAAFASWLADRFPNRPEHVLLPEDRHIDIGDANALVLGLGRVGSAAFDRLVAEPDLRVIGIDSDPDVIEQLSGRGEAVVEGDATDRELWARMRGDPALEVAVFALPNRQANATAIDLVRRSGFTGTVGVITHDDEDAGAWANRGVDASLSLYAGAGAQLAEQALLNRPSPPRGSSDDGGRDQ